MNTSGLCINSLGVEMDVDNEIKKQIGQMRILRIAARGGSGLKKPASGVFYFLSCLTYRGKNMLHVNVSMFLPK